MDFIRAATRHSSYDDDSSGPELRSSVLTKPRFFRLSVLPRLERLSPCMVLTGWECQGDSQSALCRRTGFSRPLLMASECFVASESITFRGIRSYTNVSMFLKLRGRRHECFTAPESVDSRPRALSNFFKVRFDRPSHLRHHF